MYSDFAKKSSVYFIKAAALLLAACLFFAASPFCSAARAASDYSWVRVKLTTNNATSLSLGVSGAYFIEENGIEFSGGTLTIRSAGGSMTLTHSSLGDIFSGSRCSIKRANVDRSAGFLSLNGRKYLGHFNLRLISSGYIQVVNQVPMAQYLYGVVGYEMSELSFPIEALKAQAIAAKCYVINQMGSYSEYDIGGTSADQVYKGYNASYTNVINAVDSTLPMVLSSGGTIICTYFSASNGGETTLPGYAWPAKNRSNLGYAISLDPSDLANSYSPKEVVRFPINTGGSISAPLYQFIISKAGASLGIGIIGIDSITSVSTFGEANAGTTRNLTQCAITLNVRDASGMIYPASFTFRLSELYANNVVNNGSLRIYWGEQSGDTYNIYHLRYGHGVGLSQRGAQQRASEGQSYEQILAFYYPQSSLTATNAIQAPSNPVNSRAGMATPAPGSLPVVPTPAPGTEPLGGVIAYGMINYDDTNFRSGPSTSFPSYGKLNTGAALEILGESGSWYHVRVNGQEAYVYKQYVDVTGTPSVSVPTAAPLVMPAPAQPSAVALGTLTTKSVNFRSSASTSSSILGKFDKGDSVTIYRQDGDWLYVSIENVYGYVHSDYVKVQTISAAPAPVTSAVPTTGSAPLVSSLRAGMLSTSNVNMRSEASTSSTSLRKLSKNTAVTVISESGSWYYVLVDGQYGYVYKKYVKITGSASQSSAGTPAAAASSGSTGTGITTGKVNLRTSPSTAGGKLATLSKGTSLVLYGESGGWYKVSAGGKSGYVSGKYLNVTASYASASPSGTTTLISGGSSSASAATGNYGETIKKVNFREGPSTSSKKIALLPKGAKLVLYGLNKGWFEAVYNMRRGYLSAEYVMVGSPLGGNDTAAQSIASAPSPSGTALLPSSGVSAAVSAEGSVSPAAGVTNGEVNFRTLPDTQNGAIIETLNKETRVQLLGRSGDWYYAFYNNNTGYLSGAYINFSAAGSFGLPEVAAGTRGYSTTTKSAVNMRRGPATTHSLIRKLNKNTALTVLLTTDGWCLVLQSGEYGFVSSDYINVK